MNARELKNLRARAAVVRGRFGRSGHKSEHEVAISNTNL
jgi:hypothetical protein